MSVEKAVEQIDFILNILDEAEKKTSTNQCCHDDSTHKHEHGHSHGNKHDHHHEHGDHHHHHHAHAHAHDTHDHAHDTHDHAHDTHDHAHDTHDHSHDHDHQHQQQRNVPTDIPTNIQYFKSPSDIKTGMNLRITPDPKLLGQCWDEAGLGPMDELESLCNVIGSVQEIEDNDNTVELRWENYDTAWIPIKACYDAGDKKPTLPGIHTSWLSPDNEENKHSEHKENDTSSSQQQQQQQQPQEEEVDESQIKYFETVEDEYIKPGAVVRVTKSIELLEKYWKQSELGPNDTKHAYLGVYGLIQQVEEDDDTIEVRWANYDTVWIPVQATSAAPGKKETLPTESVSHVEDE